MNLTAGQLDIVDDEGRIKIGREIIHPEQQEVLLDVLMALERERLGLPSLMHGTYREARIVHTDEHRSTG